LSAIGVAEVDAVVDKSRIEAVDWLDLFSVAGTRVACGIFGINGDFVACTLAQAWRI